MAYNVGYVRGHFKNSRHVKKQLENTASFSILRTKLTNAQFGLTRNDVLRDVRGRVRDGRHVGRYGMGHGQRHYVENVQAHRVHRPKLREPVGKRLSGGRGQGPAHTRVADQQPGEDASGSHAVRGQNQLAGR